MRRRTKEWAGAAVIAGVVSGVMVLAPEADPYADELAQARETASDFQLEVLADGRISDAELEDAFQQWQDCLHGQGIDPGDGDSPALFGPHAQRCYETTLGTIDQLKWQMDRDPTKKGVMVVVAECLDRNGALPDRFTPADFRGVDETIDAGWGLDMSDPLVMSCFTDPQGH